ncbi:COX15/CtaA family protein [Planctobacterium marinum]|uniref:Cytochrome b561 n=1 Tax=Planctobacterium marinum TaxID=1631968 RepID=A0AA48I274_9ALTE|nr:cytochrome b561 [Planctobacterium marinum]
MKTLVKVSIFLTIVVIILGAYTRLTDSGLGCPDWPGCYGHMVVPKSDEAITKAEIAFPERPLEASKAWIEMIHRYFAGTLGLLILFIFIIALKNRQQQTPVKLPFVILLLVIFQAALGMWTVTMNLLPVVVMGHLLGGFTLLSLLFLLHLRMKPYRIPGGDPRVRKYGRYATLGLFILVIQIALGGWTSANYAALACTELPICEGNWYEKLNFSGAFSVPEADNYEFGAHPYDERMTMHIVHRFGALITFLYLCWLGIRLYTSAISDRVKNQSVLMVSLLGVQIALGVSNVVFSLPIVVAVAHNAVAALLLLALILLNYTLYRKA